MPPGADEAELDVVEEAAADQSELAAAVMELWHRAELDQHQANQAAQVDNLLNSMCKDARLAACTKRGGVQGQLIEPVPLELVTDALEPVVDQSAVGAQQSTRGLDEMPELLYYDLSSPSPRSASPRSDGSPQRPVEPGMEQLAEMLQAFWDQSPETGALLTREGALHGGNLDPLLESELQRFSDPSPRQHSSRQHSSRQLRHQSSGSENSISSGSENSIRSGSGARSLLEELCSSEADDVGRYWQEGADDDTDAGDGARLETSCALREGSTWRPWRELPACVLPACQSGGGAEDSVAEDSEAEGSEAEEDKEVEDSEEVEESTCSENTEQLPGNIAHANQLLRAAWALHKKHRAFKALEHRNDALVKQITEVRMLQQRATERAKLEAEELRKQAEIMREAIRIGPSEDGIERAGSPENILIKTL